MVHDPDSQKGAAADATVSDFVGAKRPALAVQDREKAACQAVEQLISAAVASTGLTRGQDVLDSVLGITMTGRVELRDAPPRRRQP
ncbi:hypothetical protein [Streptomyces albipurpureus]|uniref:Uncharacterized protein n=1 Tax=Streptomyces albipurpureus TaxID=2897419 RepID=A0ABT0V018_9ACTN|nr:hypothetical protein [Streptomyces sp. CWNU-1]MCM2394064.1 hypothetical protein [Streptomyces sp. CWNU-1]